MFEPQLINNYLQQLNENYDENLMIKLKAIKNIKVNTNTNNIQEYNPYILWFLHKCYYKGLGVGQDLKVAYEYLKCANNKLNNLYFKFDLGVLYEHGMGCEINNELAFECYNECYEMLKESKNKFYLPVVYFKLGYFFSNGFGTNKDINKALEFYKISSDLNNHKACYYLGVLYYLGTEVPRDLNLAFKLFEKSAIISNYSFHRAVYKLGFFYEHGIGTPINYNKAVEVYKYGIRINCIDCIQSFANLYINKKLKFEIPVNK